MMMSPSLWIAEFEVVMLVEMKTVMLVDIARLCSSRSEASIASRFSPLWALLSLLYLVALIA